MTCPRCGAETVRKPLIITGVTTETCTKCGWFREPEAK